MSEGTLRKVSRRSSAQRRNNFYAVLETKLNNALIDNTELAPNLLEEFYVCNRLTAIPPENKQALLERVPADIRGFAISDAQGDARVDALELDFIDFLQTYKSNRILSVVGAVGVGKTTFLRYILRGLRRESASLKSYLPLFLNCVALASPRPKYHDLLFELVHYVRESVLDDPAIDRNSVEVILSDFSRLQPTLRAASDFVELVRRLGAACCPGFQPVLIFDNVDQLSPTVVADIVALARSTHLRTGICVVTAMRPATHSTQVELQRGSRAFYSFLLEVTPPDLRAVVRRRMHRVLESVGDLKIVGTRGVTLSIEDPERAINSLTSKILHPRIQEIFLRDICNNDVRRALAGFSQFLRYRELRTELLFDTKTPGDDDSSQGRGSWFDHLLDGLMIGDREHYAEVKETPVVNIFAFEHQGRLDYLVQYVALSLLSWAGRFVERRTVVGWMGLFGYDAAFATEVLRRLLSIRLIYSPEVERPYELESAHSVRLSTSGDHYVNHLVQHPQYLYNVIYDVDLPHSGYRDFASDGFASRMSSVSELLDMIFRVESSQLAHLLASRSGVYVLGAVKNSGLLTRRILTAAEALLERGKHARFEGPRSASSEYEPQFQRLSADLKTGEIRIENELLEQNFISARTNSQQVVEKSVGRANNIRLRVPSQLAPGSKNRVLVEVDLDGISEVNPVVMYWRGVNDVGQFEEIAELKRRHERATYEGEFSISEVTSISAFPSSSVTIFAGSDPVLVTKLQSPRQNGSLV